MTTTAPSLLPPSLSVVADTPEAQSAEVPKLNPDRLVRTFNGTSDPLRWTEQIRSAAALGKWPTSYTVLIARNHLTGEAQTYIENCVGIGEELTLGHLEALLKAQYRPDEKLIVRLQRFGRCMQETNETLMAYAARVRSLGLLTCDREEEKAFIEKHLLAQLIFGMQSCSVRNYILGRDPQTLHEAVSLGLEAEAQENATGRRRPAAAISVVTSGNPRDQPRHPNRYTARSQSGNRSNCGQKCTFCFTQHPGEPNDHLWAECRRRLTYENRCFTCKKTGHFMKECPPASHPGRPPLCQTPRQAAPFFVDTKQTEPQLQATGCRTAVDPSRR
jgi:hypothetical protein